MIYPVFVMMMNDDWLINYLGPAIHFVTLTLTLRVPSWTYTALVVQTHSFLRKLLSGA